MTTRRDFLISASGVTTASVMTSLMTATLAGCGGSNPNSTILISDANLQAEMNSKLSLELNDATTAKTLVPIQFDVGLTWDLPTIAASQINRIVAYSFGNRPNAASGNTSANATNQAALPDPGPINEALADAVHEIYLLKPVKVYAQWEIARFLVSKYQMNSSNLVSIEPVTASDGTITYLSTDGVAAAIIGHEGSAAAMGNVAVVGHRDHAKRCIETSVARGMAAAAVAGVNLPVNYDPLSGQPWTRRRDLYLVHDMYAQLAVKAAALTSAAYPNG
jgi:hypothetical protein